MLGLATSVLEDRQCKGIVEVVSLSVEISRRKQFIMPRSRGSSRASRPAAMRPRPVAAPPVVKQAPTPPAQYQQPGGGGAVGGIGRTIADGMAFGGGSAVAHRAVDAVIGPRTVTHEVVQSTQNPTSAGSTRQSQEFEACANQAKAFRDCLSFNADDIGKCQFYVDTLKECQNSQLAGPASQAPAW